MADEMDGVDAKITIGPTEITILDLLIFFAMSDMSKNPLNFIALSYTHRLPFCNPRWLFRCQSDSFKFLKCRFAYVYVSFFFPYENIPW